LGVFLAFAGRLGVDRIILRRFRRRQRPRANTFGAIDPAGRHDALDHQSVAAVAFLVFRETLAGKELVLRPTGETFSLAGHNLLYRAWESRGRPLNSGWMVTREELVRLRFEADADRQKTRLIIDFHPTSTGRIGLIEPVNIYAYTCDDGEGGALWTPLMLRMRHVFYLEYEEELSPDKKAQVLGAIPCRDSEEESIEFLYLNGDSYGWNWGRSGMTNAAFIQGGAREYFRQFF
jgi:hypothetical protein